MTFPKTRTINLIALVISTLLLLISFYFQFVKNMQPCLLCELQRASLVILIVIFLLAFLQNPKKLGVIIYAMLSFIASVAGIIFAARQSWLQQQPPGTQETCLPSLQFLIKTRPLPEVLQIMFHGGSDCAAVAWRFLSLSMAEWTLLCFIFFAVVSVSLLFAANR